MRECTSEKEVLVWTSADIPTANEGNVRPPSISKLTKSVVAEEYSTRMSRYLKNLAASCDRPTTADAQREVIEVVHHD